MKKNLLMKLDKSKLLKIAENLGLNTNKSSREWLLEKLMKQTYKKIVKALQDNGE